MKGYRYINAMQSIASYMVGFETNRITYDEFNSWSQYLEKTLSIDDCQAIVFYGKNYLDELEHEDKGFLFNIGHYSISLANGKTKADLDEHVLSYVDADILLALLDAPAGYEKEKESEDYAL